MNNVYNLAEEMRMTLKRQLSGDEQHKNPLLVMGLSPDILSLGLNDDDLWEYCRSMSRFLVARFHPDRQKDQFKDVAELQTSFMSAFEVLKDQALFMRALDEFKQITATERSEKNLIKRDYLQLRSRHVESIELLRKEIQEGQNRIHELESISGRYLTSARRKCYYEGQMYSSKNNAGVIEEATWNRCTGLLVFDVVFSFEPGGVVPPSDSYDHFHEAYRRRIVEGNRNGETLKKTREDLRSALNRHGIENVSIASLLEQAELETWSHVIWNDSTAFRKYGFDRLVSNKKNNTLIPEVSEQAVKSFMSATGKAESDIKQKCKIALGALRKWLTRYGHGVCSSFALKLRYMPLREDCEHTDKNKYICFGSMRPEHTPFLTTKADRVYGPYESNPFRVDRYAHLIDPLIVVGNLLVLSTPVSQLQPIETVSNLGKKNLNIPRIKVNNLVVDIAV